MQQLHGVCRVPQREEFLQRDPVTDARRFAELSQPQFPGAAQAPLLDEFLAPSAKVLLLGRPAKVGHPGFVCHVRLST